MASGGMDIATLGEKSLTSGDSTWPCGMFVSRCGLVFVVFGAVAMFAAANR